MKSSVDVVRVRLVARSDLADGLGQAVVELLERQGMEVLEWTPPKAADGMDEGKSKVFIQARAKEQE